jgi:hypothetical protein
VSILAGVFIGWFVTWLYHDERETRRIVREAEVALDRLIRRCKTPAPRHPAPYTEGAPDPARLSGEAMP